MQLKATTWFNRLGLNTRILLLTGLPLVATAAITTILVHWSTQRFVEKAIGDQMVMEARIVAHLVAIAEQKRPQGMTPAEINAHLKEIARFAKDKKGYDYEFWVTDGSGKVSMGSEDTEFTFQADQEQAGEFLRLLGRGPDRADFVVQESRKREIDNHVYKYVGVSGVDQPRIVEVGYRTDSLFAELAFKNYLLAAGVAGLLLAAALLGNFTLRRVLTKPLAQLIRATRAVEAEEYEIGTLNSVRTRGDELGRLASVFEDMVGKLATRYESLVNFMRAVVIKVDGDRIITFANHYAADLFGYTNAELVGQRLELVVPPEWHEEVRRRIDSLRGEQVQVNEVNQNVTKSGERIWIAWSNRVIKAGEGREKELLCVGNDVTEMMRHKKELEGLVEELEKTKEEAVRSEERLRKTEEYFRGVLERAPDGLLVVDADGTITMANAQCEKLFGYTRDELIFQKVEMLVPDSIRPQHPELRASFHRAPTTRAMGAKSELYGRRKDGSLLPVDIGLSPLPGRKGAEIQVAVSIRDVTERKQAEVELKAAKQKAEEATRMKSMFLANMSHEIRTPMNAIIGLSHLALKTQLTPKQRDYVSKVHNAGTSLLAVINDILDFSKIEAGKLDVESTDFRLDDVISSVTTVTGQKATDKGLEFLAHVAPGIPQFLIGDPHRLGQILTNLVNNAVKFTERGEIVVSAALLQQTGEKCQLKFSVKDTGIGMNKEQAAKLFQPFTQADMSTTRKYGGTGLGLTVCRRLVELMGGQIWLDSEPGVGTTFIFTVWVGVGQQKDSKIIPERLTTMRALIVDDNAGAREIIDDLLTGVVAHTDAVASGPEAIAAIQQADGTAPYDVVFMDWRMPGMDGLQAARTIKADASLNHQPAIVMVTAFGRDEVREEAEHLQLDGFLVKPVTRSMLVDALVSTFAEPGDHVAAVASATAEGVNLTGLRVLLVEDNDINQQIAVELLEGVGAKVDIANNGKEAVDRLFNGPIPPLYDVVLMDLQMPVMDGHQANAKIRSDPRFASLPIYAMTAHATLEERDHCLANGMAGHIAKPIDPALLFDTLGKVAPRLAQTAAKADTASQNGAGSTATDELPVVDGLDSTDGLRRVGGNKKLYTKLLREFASQQADVVSRIRAALAAKDTESATRLSHTLKGVAGSLGAGIVQTSADAVEKLLRDRAEADQTNHALERLAAVLDPIVARLGAALASTPMEVAATTAVAPARTRAVAEQLRKLFAQFDTNAVVFVEENQAILRPAFDAATWEQFQRHTQDFAFADAQTLLDQALAQMPAS